MIVEICDRFDRLERCNNGENRIVRLLDSCLLYYIRINFVRRLIIVSLYWGCWPKRDIIKLDAARFSVMKPSHLHRVTCICRRAPRDSLKDPAIIRVITDMNIHRGRGEKGLKESDY